jgi:uncharacterized membrane protein YoaK (UPF0700 family)
MLIRLALLRPSAAISTARLLYVVQAALLLAFLLAGVLASPVRNAHDFPVVMCGMPGAVAMGVQNAHGRLVNRRGVPNTVMTGNVTQALLDALDLLSGSCTPEARPAARVRLERTFSALCAFAAGAIAGGTAYAHASFWALVLPFGLLIWLAGMARGGRPDPAVETARSGPV